MNLILLAFFMAMIRNTLTENFPTDETFYSIIKETFVKLGMFTSVSEGVYQA